MLTCRHKCLICLHTYNNLPCNLNAQMQSLLFVNMYMPDLFQTTAREGWSFGEKSLPGLRKNLGSVLYFSSHFLCDLR